MPHLLHEPPISDPPASAARSFPQDVLLPRCTPEEYGLGSEGRDGVTDLVRQFTDATATGPRIGVWPNGLTKWPRYTDTPDNQSGVDNHFQGFQRLRAPRYAALSGGDPHEPMSQVFILHLHSRGEGEVWGSNLLESGLPPEADGCIARIDLNATL